MDDIDDGNVLDRNRQPYLATYRGGQDDALLTDGESGNVSPEAPSSGGAVPVPEGYSVQDDDVPQASEPSGSGDSGGVSPDVLAGGEVPGSSPFDDGFISPGNNLMPADEPVERYEPFDAAGPDSPAGQPFPGFSADAPAQGDGFSPEGENVVSGEDGYPSPAGSDGVESGGIPAGGGGFPGSSEPRDYWNPDAAAGGGDAGSLGFGGDGGGYPGDSLSEPSGMAPDVSDGDIPPGLGPDAAAQGSWDAPGAASGEDSFTTVQGDEPWSAGSPSDFGGGDDAMNSAFGGSFGEDTLPSGDAGGMGREAPRQLSQEEAIDEAQPSEKNQVTSHKNLATFLNRNMLFVALAGGIVVVILFFTVILPILRPDGGGSDKREFAAGGGVVPKEISDIPNGVAVDIPEPVPEPEPEPVREEDFSSKFPDPSSPTEADYTYDYTVTSGYSGEAEYDSSADVQQVGFSDVELSVDNTMTELKSRIASEQSSEAARLIQEYQKRKLDSTWMPYRPAEGYEDVSALAASPALGGSGTSASGASGSGLGMAGASGGDLSSLYSQMLSKGGAGPAYSYDQQNMQANKGQFRQAQASAGNYKYNGSTTLWKGTIIPAVLETAINTDLPGMVVATVTQNIYSSYDGKYLLIPQGSKVFAEYNSSISYNQGRVQIAWNTLIRPDGLEIDLGRVDGVDAQGHSGVPGAVSRHPFEYAKAMALIAIFSVVNTKMVNTVNGYGKGKGANGEDLTNDYYENLYSDMQSEANKISGDIISRALDIQPTIAIDSGTKVNLITNATMVLPPLQKDMPKKKYVREK